MSPLSLLVKLDGSIDDGGMFQKLHEMVADADGCLVIFLFHELGMMALSSKIESGLRGALASGACKSLVQEASDQRDSTDSAG